MRSCVILFLGVLAWTSGGCESADEVKPPALPDSLAVSGTIWKPQIGDSVPARGAQVYTWPQHGIVYTDTLGHYTLRIGAATDSAEIIGEIPDRYGGGYYFRLNRIAIPADRHDVTLNFTLEYYGQPQRLVTSVHKLGR
jgi:hypothetical protein